MKTDKNPKKNNNRALIVIAITLFIIICSGWNKSEVNNDNTQCNLNIIQNNFA